MVRAGLPEGEYICKKDGVFVADDTVELRIDAVEFERLSRLAESSETEEEIFQYYSKAFELYKGEFKEAFQLYDKTVRLYSEEMGLPPSEQMLKCYERMSQKITSLPSEITDIKGELKGKEKKCQEGDAYTRYSTSQYLILLVGTRQEDCAMIYRRINRKLKELAGSRAEFSYNVTSLAELPEELMEEE